MKRKDLLQAIRNHKGPIAAGVLLRDDVVYVRVYKDDLLQTLANVSDGQAYVSFVDGTLYLDNCSN